MLQEEALTADIKGLQNEEQEYERTLGVESYDYRRAKLDERPYMEVKCMLHPAKNVFEGELLNLGTN